MVDKRPSDQVASDAGKILRSSSSSKRDKELAASILANREPAQPAYVARLRAALRALKKRDD
jgi:hypothetical protein